MIVTRVFTEYDDDSHSRKRNSALKARNGERRQTERRVQYQDMIEDCRSGLERRLNIDRRFILKPADSIIKVRSHQK